MTFRPTWELRAAFARRMAAMYGREVPAYTRLVEVSAAVNAEVSARDGAAAQRLGSLDRVTAERHGAIRVGTRQELHDAGRIFAAFGMFPVGCYDLRDSGARPVPVVSTAFRPTDEVELARNPFRMFTSVLVADDRRFFPAELGRRVESFLARRTLFPPELLALADRAGADHGLDGERAERFLGLATDAFALSAEPVDRGWYAELEAVSPVAADIAGVASTHINHLTPRVLDIDELHRRMTASGVAMIDEIQGPPAWAGPDVLLRQTSFRALAEERLFRALDGTVMPGALRVRFGEVEARGVALTPTGRDRYDSMLVEVDRRLAAGAGTERADVARSVWAENLSDSEVGLIRDDLAYFRYSLPEDARRWIADRGVSPADPVVRAGLVAAGRLTATPIVYEDFLPRSAAGIFRSNAEGSSAGAVPPAVDWSGVQRDADWLAGVLDRMVAEPTDLYAAQQQTSLDKVLAALGH